MTALQETPENRLTMALIAAADANPDKYVVMRGTTLLGVVDTRDEAFAIWTDAWQEGETRVDEVYVLPPAAQREAMRQIALGRRGRGGVEPPTDYLPPWVRNVVNTVSDGTGVKLTRQQAFDLVSERPSLRGEIEEFGANDTVCREHLADALIKKVLGEGSRWPTFGDKVDFKAFHTKLAEAARIKGYVVEVYEEDEEEEDEEDE